MLNMSKIQPKKIDMQIKQDLTLNFRFTPASFISNFVPLIIIFSKEVSLHFEHKMWNVLTIAKNVTFSQLEADQNIVNLVLDIVDEYECEEHIYIYGDNVCSDKALYYATVLRANSVYTKVKGLTNAVNISVDVTHPTPIFYLDKSKLDMPSTLLTKLEDKCKTNNIPIRYDLITNEKEHETDSIKTVLDFFEKVASKV